MPNIGEAFPRPYRSAAAIAADPDHGCIVCHCERVTRGELLAAVRGAIPPRDLDGLRRRTRALTRPRRLLTLARGTGEIAVGALLFAAPALSGYGYAGALLWMPDLTVVLLAEGGLLALIGATRIVLRLRALSAARVEIPTDGRAAAAPAFAGSSLLRRPPRPSRRLGRDPRRTERSPTRTRERQ